MSKSPNDIEIDTQQGVNEVENNKYSNIVNHLKDPQADFTRDINKTENREDNIMDKSSHPINYNNINATNNECFHNSDKLKNNDSINDFGVEQTELDNYDNSVRSVDDSPFLHDTKKSFFSKFLPSNNDNKINQMKDHKRRSTIKLPNFKKKIARMKLQNIDPDMTRKNRMHFNFPQVFTHNQFFPSTESKRSRRYDNERSKRLAQFLLPSQDFFHLYIYSHLFEQKTMPTHEELLKLEAYRKEVVRKSYHSGVLMLCAFDATVLRYIISDLLFWLSIFVYLFMRFFALKDSTVNIPSSGIAAVGSIMSILLVYYLNSGFNRYYNIYYTCMSVQGRIFDFSIMSRSYLSTEKCITLWRYLNAAQILGYMSFSRIHNEDNFFKPLNDKHQFLTETEYESLKSAFDLRSSGSAYREILEWATEELEEEVKSKRLSEYRAYKLQEQILILRSKLASLVDYKQLPVPFIYVHYVHLMCALYLPLFALLIAFSFNYDPRFEIIGMFVVILNSTFVLGIRDICTKLQDPFGMRPVHFNVIHFVNVAIVGSYNLIFLRKQHCDRSSYNSEANLSEVDEEQDNSSIITRGNSGVTRVSDKSDTVAADDIMKEVEQILANNHNKQKQHANGTDTDDFKNSDMNQNTTTSYTTSIR